MATLQDIANQLNLSTGIVSGVLNGKDGVRAREATRQKILDLARELNYHPSASARALVTGRTMQIAVVADESVWLQFQENPFSELQGLMMTVARAGYRLLVLPPVKAQNTASIAEIARAGDGLCVFAAGFDADFFAALQKSGARFVALGNPGDACIPQVDQDNYRQYFASVKWLASQGHRRILLVHTIGRRGGVLPHRAVINRAYRSAMKKFGGDFQAIIEPTIHLSPDQIAALVSEYGASAVITRGLPVTLKWRAALEAHGKRVPQDVTILAQMATHELRYVERCGLARGLACLLHDPYEAGRRAGELLLSTLDGAPWPEKPILLRGLDPCWHEEQTRELGDA